MESYMNNIRVFNSTFWWSPFLRTVKDTANFKRFSISNTTDEYIEYLRHQVVGNEHGQFFFAEDKWTYDCSVTMRKEGARKPLAMTAVSVRKSVLYFHFYWSSSYRPEDLLVIKDIADAVCKYFGRANPQHVMLPLPIELHGTFGDYAKGIVDEHRRKLVWYEFTFKNFVSYTQFILPERTVRTAVA